MPGTPAGRALKHMRNMARNEGKEFVVLKGNGRLMRNLVNGKWPPGDYCIVPPNCRIKAVYDWDEVVRSNATV
jgi:hypothetical protein